MFFERSQTTSANRPAPVSKRGPRTRAWRGAGRRPYRPVIELLEDRRLLSFAGSYTGHYGGQDSFGNEVPVSPLAFTVDGVGNIAVSNPGSGSGTVTPSGSATIGGAGGIGNYSGVNYSYAGTFVVSAGGVVLAGGTWTAAFGGGTAHGSWGASDRAGVFGVVNNHFIGAGTLLQACKDVNNYPAPATILFSIGSGPQTIVLVGNAPGQDPSLILPHIGTTVTVDGTSQPGYAGKPLITLQGEDSLVGLELDGANSVVEGLNVTGASVNGVAGTGLYVSGSGSKILNNQTEGNIFGIGAGTGCIVAGNVSSDGIGVGSGCTVIGNNISGGGGFTGTNLSLSLGSNNTVGGTTPGARNVLASVSVGGSGNLIEGNYIGTDPTGTNSAAGGGVRISGNSNTLLGNVISGNNSDGVSISGSGNVVLANFIGADVSGTKALANSGHGIYVTGSSNTIGGTGPGAGNVIAFNTKQGVSVFSGAGNAILGNAIFGNGAIGIDLGDNGVTPNDSKGHTGPNNYQNFPVLNSVNASGVGTAVTGTLSSTANTSFRLEFFAAAAGDPSGNGQGQAFLGFATVATNSSGAASFMANLPASVRLGQVISATATDPNNNTSEFSAWIQIKVSSFSIPIPKGFPLTTLVAAFIGATPSATVGQFTAGIAWGDGTTSSGAITQPGGAGTAFYVTGSHTYSTIGALPVTVTIHDTSSNSDVTVNSQAAVRKPDLNDLFVAQVYLDLLQRNVDVAGLNYWANALDQGALTRGQVAAQLTAGQEYQTDVVNSLYQKVLRHAPDSTGLSTFTSLLAAGSTAEQVEAQLLGSDDYFANQGGGTNSGFLTALYKDVLNRPIDAAGLQNWQQALANGTSRSAVAAQIIATREAETDAVQGFYQEFLHRPADNAGLNSFVQAMQQGTPGLQVIVALVGSGEFAQRAGGNANRALVSQLYVDLLHRQADAGGLASFTGGLDSGGLTRQAVVQAMLGSQEYRIVKVSQLYQTYLHRSADTGGLSSLTNLLSQGGTDEQAGAILAGSQEYFQNRGGGTNGGFLNAFYLDALGRPIDSAGLNAWQQALANGTTRAQVATAIFAGLEYRQDLVQSFYQTYLHHSADPGGLAAFSNLLANGARDESVIAILVGSQEYGRAATTPP